MSRIPRCIFAGRYADVSSTRCYNDVLVHLLLNLLLLESTLDDEPPAAVYTAARTQFSEQKLCHVLVVSLHALRALHSLALAKKNSRGLKLTSQPCLPKLSSCCLLVGTEAAESCNSCFPTSSDPDDAIVVGRRTARAVADS